MLNESQISPNPIKLQKFTFTDDGTTLVINDMTTISQPLSTEYELQFQLSADGFHPTYTVDQIKQSLSNCELITFFGKVLHLAEPTVVSAKNLKLVASTFADTTGQITINLWAELTKEMETGKVYRIGPIQFRGWNGIKKLSTTPNSIITSVSDQEELTNLTNFPYQNEHPMANRVQLESQSVLHSQHALSGNLCPLHKLRTVFASSNSSQVHTVSKCSAYLRTARQLLEETICSHFGTVR